MNFNSIAKWAIFISAALQIFYINEASNIFFDLNLHQYKVWLFYEYKDPDFLFLVSDKINYFHPLMGFLPAINHIIDYRLLRLFFIILITISLLKQVSYKSYIITIAALGLTWAFIANSLVLLAFTGFLLSVTEFLKKHFDENRQPGLKRLTQYLLFTLAVSIVWPAAFLVFIYVLFKSIFHGTRHHLLLLITTVLAILSSVFLASSVDWFSTILEAPLFRQQASGGSNFFRVVENVSDAELLVLITSVLSGLLFLTTGVLRKKMETTSAALLIFTSTGFYILYANALPDFNFLLYSGFLIGMLFLQKKQQLFSTTAIRFIYFVVVGLFLFINSFFLYNEFIPKPLYDTASKARNNNALHIVPVQHLLSSRNLGFFRKPAKLPGHKNNIILADLEIIPENIDLLLAGKFSLQGNNAKDVFSVQAREYALAERIYAMSLEKEIFSKQNGYDEIIFYVNDIHPAIEGKPYTRLNLWYRKHYADKRVKVLLKD